MSEEQDKQKPKATLIKHRKPDPAKAAGDDKQERKKVVVVKKKPAKPAVKVVATHSEDTGKAGQNAPVETNKTGSAERPAEAPVKPAASPESAGNSSSPESRTGNSAAGKPAAAGERRPSQVQHGPRPNYPPRPGQDGRSGGYQGRSGQDGSRPNYPPRSGQDGGRPNYPPRTGQDGSRPNYPPRQGQEGRTGAYHHGTRPNYPPRPGQEGARTGGYQGSRPNYPPRPGQEGARTGGYQGNRPNYPPRPGQGGRPGGFQGRPGQDGRPPYQGQGGGRPFTGNRPAPGGSSSPDSSAEKKTSSKKFFKSKKKDAYSKTKKETIKERDFQIKKKSSQMANPIPKEIDVMDVITVSELARKMNLKASELITKLMGMGMMVTINQQIDAETVEIIANEYNCKVNIVSLYDETIIESDTVGDDDLRPRAPIVTIMGHVDHGKTKLLDAIRSTNVVAGEFGGITQHIGAYKVSMENGDIVFLDTPGHAAFTLMRARGAQITDIVVLVVAANDGVMPQTIEAIEHAKEAKVPIIVAVNKVDLPEANPDRVKQQLSEYELISEDWGGSTQFVPISALKKQGIDDLLEAILLQAEILELKANYNCRAEGKVIESKIDPGRGIVSTVIVERGTLRVGDTFIAGVYPGKVRAMFNDKGEKIEEAAPATPVEILGFSGVPSSGAPFQVTENEKIARQVGTKRQELEKHSEAKNLKKITLDNLYDTIQHGEVQELKVIIKGDVHGSVEALKTALEKLSTPEIRLVAIRASAGAIIEDDINLASASNAIVIGFHVRPTAKAQALADQEKVEIRKYNVIYDCFEDIKAAMEGLLAPELKEEIIGTVEVRDVIKVPKIGLIAGSYVSSGKIVRNGNVRVYRDGNEIYTGKVSSLKRFKDDAKEVEKGYECGVGIDNNMDIQIGDVLEVYVIKEVAKKLSSSN